MTKTRIRWLAAVLAAAALAMGCRWNWQQTGLASRMIRLHVVANSDREDDQALKLQVRDEVLSGCRSLLAGTETVSEARSVLGAHLTQLADRGAAVVQREGYRYPVRVSLEYTGFPAIDYGGFALPAGEYQALRVELGSGEGHNWWCVLYPALCDAPEVSQTAMAAGLTDEDLPLMEGQNYQLRFRCVELWEQLMEKLRKGNSP